MFVRLALRLLTSSDTLSTAHYPDCITWKSDIIWGSCRWFPWEFPNQKCWVFHFEPETIHAWKHPSLPAPKSFHLQIRWWSKSFGIEKLCVYRLSSKGTHHQWRVWCQLAEAVTICYQEQTPRTKDELFHQSNTPAHRTLVSMAAVRDYDFELVDHPLWFRHICLSSIL